MTTTSKDLAAAIAANRFGLGARPGELTRLGDPQAWLRQQLREKPPVLAGEGLKPSAETLARVIELRREAVAERRDKKKEGADEEALKAVAFKLPAVYRPIYIDEIAARFSHSVATERPFLERLTQFWTNHFAVSIDKNVVLGLAGAMEREAIRLLAQLCSPFAPHLAEECWMVMGGKGMVATAKWPVADPAMLVSDTVLLPVQVNGKKRAEITLPRDASNEAVEAAAKADDNVKPFLVGLTVRKVVVVPGRIVNIVAS